MAERVAKIKPWQNGDQVRAVLDILDGFDMTSLADSGQALILLMEYGRECAATAFEIAGDTKTAQAVRQARDCWNTEQTERKR